MSKIVTRFILVAGLALASGCGPGEEELRLAAQNESLMKERDQFAAEKDALREELETRYADLEAKLSNTQEDFESAQASTTQQEAALTSAREEIETTATEITTLRERVQAAEAELQASRAQGESLSEASTELSAQLETFEQEKSDIVNQNKNLQEMITTLEGRLQSSVPTKEADAMRTQLEDQRARAVTIEQEREQIASERQGLKEIVATLEERLQSSVAKSELQTMHAKLQELQVVLADTEQRNDRVMSDNESLLVRIQKLERGLESSTVEQGSLRERLTTTSGALDEAKNRATELNQSYATLLEEKAGLESMSATSQAELDETRQSLEQAQSEVARLSGGRGIYTVQRGDYLSTISAFFYRDASRWRDVHATNSFLITDPDLIYPGMVLVIPK